jgi:hypothetical protein
MPFWRKLYAFLEKSLLIVKQVMENHICVKEIGLLQYGPSCFYKDNQYEGHFKQNYSPSRNERSRKNHEGSTYGYLAYPKDL